MTPVETLKAAQNSRLVDEDEEEVRLKFLPGLSPREIEQRAEEFGFALPEELKELLQFTAGVDGFGPEIDFTGRSMAFEQLEVFPHGLPFAADGFGNFWVLDLTSATNKSAPVFFACHDAPVILYQCADLATFMVEAVKTITPPHKSLINDVHDDRIFDVWQKNPGVVERSEGIRSSDSALKKFAEELTDDFQIIDLRNVPTGMGLSWGRYGPQTELKRFGEERIFAYRRPAKKSLFGKLFGGD